MKNGLEKGMELSIFIGNGLARLVVLLKEGHINHRQTNSNAVWSVENVKL